MKKLVLALLMCFSVSLFATEKDMSINFSTPTIINLENDAKIPAIAFGIAGNNWLSEKLSFYSSIDFGFVRGGGMNMDTNIGVSIRPLNLDKFSLLISPVANVDFLLANSLMILNLGAGLDVTANYKVSDTFYVSGGLNSGFDFYQMLLASGGSASQTCKLLKFTPHLGITFQM